MNSFQILFRTHTWNETAQKNYEQLQKSSNHEIAIIYDNTSDPGLTIYQEFPHLKNYQIYFHSIQVFEQSGLYIPPKKTLWKCGDYPLFDTILSRNLRFALMLEYDLFVSQYIDDHIRTLLEGKIDLCGKKINNKNWYWKNLYDEYCAATYLEPSNIVGGLFYPFVWASNTMAKALNDERIKQKQTMSKFNVPSRLYPFCELFTFHTCKQKNLNFMPLQKIANTSKMIWKREGGFIIEQLEASKDFSDYVHPALNSLD